MPNTLIGHMQQGANRWSREHTQSISRCWHPSQGRLHSHCFCFTFIICLAAVRWLVRKVFTTRRARYQEPNLCPLQHAQSGRHFNESSVHKRTGCLGSNWLCENESQSKGFWRIFPGVFLRLLVKKAYKVSEDGSASSPSETTRPN
jgi:hypothetical protein